MRMGEFITQALQGFLYQNHLQRKFVQFTSLSNLNEQLAQGFKQAAQYCEMMSKNASQMSSYGLLVPKVIHVDLDEPISGQIVHSEAKSLFE